jgi:cephalosporin hydroxylase
MSEILTINTETGHYGSTTGTEKFDPNWGPIQNLTYFQNVVEKNVRGWLFPFDHGIIQMILNNLQQDVTGDICEIGVAYGRSAIALSNYRREGDSLYLYDLCIDVPKEESSANINRYGTGRDIIWRVGDTMDLTEKDIEFNYPLRLLHVDGSHEHDAVLKDLTNFSPKVHKEGVIVMDDYNDPEYPGVTSAILQFVFENPEWVIFAIGQNKAYLCQRDSADKYTHGLVVFMELYEKMGLKYGPRLRGLNGRNVLLCCSREPYDIQKVKANINVPVSLT